MVSSQSNDDKTGDKKLSWYQRYQAFKRSKPLNDEDIKKYTGRSRDEIKTWAETAPGAADGFGGWGWEAGNRNMKFPPEQPKKESPGDH
ncbi:hypothetical protein B0I35DRAFT_425145 [Stachybotrys elegans]|uniref:Uncharacterized protein n=1 Tax=Stachybotrys elegans TaxID=80388 RepID=A0A8K0WUM7_9HYPO|nr:hypothetical protein B0I35DRAFT_425145 [Stachybotrys elegans]